MSDPDGPDAAWTEYLSAARRLDALRRGAVAVDDEPARAATATFEELTRLRARLAAQHSRLRTLGVPETELHPSAAELAAVDPVAGGAGDDGPEPTGPVRDGGADDDAAEDDAAAVAGPGTVWAALRRSRTLAEEADAALAPPRNLGALIRRGREAVSRRHRRS